jgi:hypothetical protein
MTLSEFDAKAFGTLSILSNGKNKILLITDCSLIPLF